MDYSKYKGNNRFYSGSEQKIGITIEGKDWILKFQKASEIGPLMNHFSEYLGSHIFQMIGLPTQNTALGTYKGLQVVAMEDFTGNGFSFVPFNDVGDSTLEEDKERFHYSYEDIMTMLEENKKLTNVEETISIFWKMYLIDALIGNFDRHGGNWGFLKKDNKYVLAPIFDNGSCLFPRLNTDEACRSVLADPLEIERRTLVFPTSQIRLGNRKSSYYDVISSLRFPECNQALQGIFPEIDLGKIFSFIAAMPECSPTRKEFYKAILKERYQKLLKEPYEKLNRKK
ncbi:MAG: HipA domain-containing protein [Bacilli bacterium]|jgi:hypothetical protein|nr:HipA domain-containing protein [Bacilli bacterium]